MEKNTAETTNLDTTGMTLIRVKCALCAGIAEVNGRPPKTCVGCGVVFAEADALLVWRDGNVLHVQRQVRTVALRILACADH